MLRKMLHCITIIYLTDCHYFVGYHCFVGCPRFADCHRFADCRLLKLMLKCITREQMKNALNDCTQITTDNSYQYNLNEMFLAKQVYPLAHKLLTL